MKQKLLIALAGAVFGGLIVGAIGFLQRLKTEHHYREIETFFRGTVAGKEVLGISYVEYDGIAFMERNQWKVLLRDHSRVSTMIYQNRPIFQEPIPHQPKIEIKGSEIVIDDGQNQFTVDVQELPHAPVGGPSR